VDILQIFVVKDHSPIEVAFWIAQVALLLVAVVGAILTVWQLVSIKKQAKASFLFELDKMWESEEFTKARTDFEVSLSVSQHAKPSAPSALVPTCAYKAGVSVK